MIGQSISRYRILRRLGAGGMGEVYEAEDTELRRKVAVKILPKDLAAKPETLDRFKREARAVAALNHPNIVTIHSVEQSGDTHFLTMELVEGRPLGDLIPPGGFALEKFFALGIPLTDALAAAHARGIGHRDLKPSNVMVNEQGRVKVIDFGLAKLFQQDTELVDREAPTVHQTMAGQILGTPAYMSPEQIEGRKLDHRTDIFSLGILLCEMATAQRPFKGDSAMSIMSSILRDAPPSLNELKPGLPEHLGRIIRRCLQKDPAERYQSALDVRNELKGLEEETKSGPRPAVAAPGDAQPALKSSPPPERSEQLSASRPSNRVQLLGVLALAILLTVGGVWFVIHKSALKAARDSDGKTSTPTAAVVPGSIESLAVLPFDNFSGDTNQNYFADGLTEELIGKLAQISALKKVVSRTSVMPYRGSTKSIPKIGQELKVDAVVQGSVVLSGTLVSIKVRLIEAASERQIWSETYDRDTADIIRIQNDVALAIAQAIRVVLTPEEQTRLTKARKVNPEAYESYLLGKIYRRTYIDADNLKAIESLERAVALDKEFASAYAALAAAYVDRFYYHVPQEYKTWEPKASLKVEQALAIEPETAEAYLARGMILWSPARNFRHEEAVADFQHALRLNPKLSEAYYQLGLVYGHTGLLDEGVAALRTASTLDPSATIPLVDEAAVHIWKGDYESALPLWSKIPRGEGGKFFVGSHNVWTLFAMRRTNDAKAILKEFRKAFPGDDTGELAGMNAVMLAADGDVAGAEAEIQKAMSKETGYGEFHHTAYFIACAYARLGKPREALDALKKAAAAGFPCYTLFDKDPNLNSLRDDAEFREFLKEQEKEWKRRKADWLKADALVKPSAARQL